MEYRPIVPYFMVVSMPCNMQFDSGICNKDKQGYQSAIDDKNPFHLFPICGFCSLQSSQIGCNGHDNNCKEMNQRLFLIRDKDTGVMPR